MKNTIAVIRCILTLPGALCQGFWELMCCRLTRTELTTGECLRKDENCGHLHFEPPKTVGAAALFCSLPFFCNLLLSLPMLLTSTINLFVMKDPGLIEYIMLWVGFSLLTNVYPTKAVTDAFWAALQRESTAKAVRILLLPAAAFFRLGARLHALCITLPMAALGAALLPFLMKWMMQ